MTRRILSSDEKKNGFSGKNFVKGGSEVGNRIRINGTICNLARYTMSSYHFFGALFCVSIIVDLKEETNWRLFSNSQRVGQGGEEISLQLN